MLIYAGSWDILGPSSESDWWSGTDLFGPSSNVTGFVPAAAPVDCRYATDLACPWLGSSPLGWAANTGRLATHLKTRLADEAGGTAADLLQIPQDDEGQFDELLTEPRGKQDWVSVSRQLDRSWRACQARGGFSVNETG